MPSCSFFTPSRFRAYSYCVFFNVARIYIGKKVLLIFFLSSQCLGKCHPAGMFPRAAHGREEDGYARLPSLCPASLDGLFGLCVPWVPRPCSPALPHAAGEARPAQPHGSARSCHATAGHKGSRGRREAAGAWRGTSCSLSRSCCKGSWFRVPLAVPVASSTSSSGQSYKKRWESQPCGVSSFKLVFNSVPKQFTFPEHQNPQSDTGRGRASPVDPSGSRSPCPARLAVPSHGGP